MNETQAEMPRYKSHKEVNALKIESMGSVEGGVKMTFADEGYDETVIPDPDGSRIMEAMISHFGAGRNKVDAGYLVVYEDGYRSWSPSQAFEEGYNRLTGEPVGGEGLTFGQMLHLLKQGARAKREGWNGPDQFIFLVPGSTFEVNRPPLLGIYPEGTEINYHAHIDIRNQQGMIVPWLASQGDLLSDDWVLSD